MGYGYGNIETPFVVNVSTPGVTNAASFGADINSADNLAAIQAALNVGGYVYIAKPGTYLIDGTLLIGSNTTFELGEGVIIRQKTTGANLLRNNDVANGNTNIAIIGGTWDYNYTGTGDTLDPHETHAIVLQNVNYLKISHVKVIDAHKYAWLLANITNLTVDGLDFDTNSDGMHLMGPINFADIRNLKGTTGDNLFAMTIGDYATYELTRGNMTNITVSGIYCNNSSEPVRLVGNPDYYFDNILIEDITGVVGAGRVVAIIQDTNLTYTDVRNLVIRNISCKSQLEQIYLTCKAGKNITIENISGGDPALGILKTTTDTNIEHLKLKNITTAANENAATFVLAGTINVFEIDGLTALKLNGSVSGLLNISGTYPEIRLKNITADYGAAFISVSGTVGRIFLDMFNVTNVTTMILKTSAGTTVLYAQNGYVSYTARFIANQSVDASLVRIFAQNIAFPSDANSRFITSGGGTISLQGATFRAKDLSVLAPSNGDMVFNTEPNFGTGVGLYIYDTSAWRKL